MMGHMNCLGWEVNCSLFRAVRSIYSKFQCWKIGDLRRSDYEGEGEEAVIRVEWLSQ